MSGIVLGLYRDNGKETGNYRDNRDYIGIIGNICMVQGAWAESARCHNIVGRSQG